MSQWLQLHSAILSDKVNNQQNMKYEEHDFLVQIIDFFLF